MNKRKINKYNLLSLTIISLILVSTITIKYYITKNKETENLKTLKTSVISINKNNITLQDKNNIIYKFKNKNINTKIGNNLIIEYTGILNKNKEIQESKIINYQNNPVYNDKSNINEDWKDNGIFSDYYMLANKKLQELTLDEKIGQLFLVRYPDKDQINILKKYNFGGYIFFEKDFQNKTKEEVKNMINNLQKNAKIKILTAVDEEGGQVTRISNNKNLVSEPFKSPSQLYKEGGLEKIKEDTKNKSNILNELGLNLNLAPVVDVSTNEEDYIYNRTIQENTEITKEYAKTVIEASKNKGVSYTLKHFPGYGNNKDTHIESTIDERSYEEIKRNDLPPFKAGIDQGAEAILISHNTIKNIDPDNPASLSPTIHNILRNEMNFTGIIITDDLDMKALSSIKNSTELAILAGNDLIITTDYEKSINEIKQAITKGTISEEQINKLAFRILSWKYYKGIMFTNQK